MSASSVDSRSSVSAVVVVSSMGPSVSNLPGRVVTTSAVHLRVGPVPPIAGPGRIRSGAMRVTEIWRYPVKSMGGETLLDAVVTDLGVEGDRGWGVFDPATGLTLTARRAPQLLMASARLHDGEVVIELPDGREIGEGQDDVLSEWLGQPVELRTAGAEGGRYENPMNVVDESDWIEWNGPPGAFHDSTRSRFTLVSTESLGEWDVRRFRTNIVVDAGGEDELVGRQIRIGHAPDGIVAEVTKRVDRCIMVTRPQPGLERDLSVLTRIRDERELCLSVGCLVSAPGEIGLGAEVEVLAD